MTKDEALKLALDAFGEIAWSNETQWQRDRSKEAITAIKEALAQPEYQSTADKSKLEKVPAKGTLLSQPEQDGVALTNIPHPNGAPAPDDLNADALEVVELELPDEDEAVGWADGGVINWIAGKQFKHASYLYTTPPQRTWVGLSDAEIKKIVGSDRYTDLLLEVVNFVEAKLKEKNCG